MENRPKKLPKKPAQELIIEKISQQTKGLIKLSWDKATEIMNIVFDNSNQAYVVQYRHNSQMKGSWEKIRNLATTDQIIDEKIKEAIQSAPVMDFYKFECFNSDGEREGSIYTINPCLFD